MDKTKEKATNLHRCLMIAVIGDLILGLGFIGFTYSRFGSWQEVEVSYQEDNCFEPMGRNGKETRCDLTISYEYNGKTYEEVKRNVNRNLTRSSTRHINPANPEEYNENYPIYYLLGGWFLICAFLCYIIDFVWMMRIRNLKESSDGDSIK